MITIRIKNLRLRTYIGFNDEEREKKQDVVINVVLTYDGDAAASSDEVGGALNYRDVTKQIIEYVEGHSFLLLEKLAGDVMAIVKRSERVSAATVEIDKPHALRFADSVSAVIEYRR
jgi:D-erythro-7,8-dihydroneopterin triphosphate epimerase